MAIANLTELVATVRDEVDELSAAAEQNSAGVKEAKALLGSLNLEALKKTVETLKTAIWGKDPRGSESLGSKLNALDGALAAIEDAAIQLATRVKSLESADLETRKEKLRANVQLGMAILAALAAIASAYLAHRGGP